jgi:hypothetical protein
VASPLVGAFARVGLSAPSPSRFISRYALIRAWWFRYYPSRGGTRTRGALRRLQRHKILIIKYLNSYMQLRLFRFEGDIFQKMDFKAFIYQYLDLNYIEADALVETLQAGESRTFQIDDEEAKFSAILSTLGLTFDFGTPKKAATKTKEEPKEEPKIEPQVQFKSLAEILRDKKTAEPATPKQEPKATPLPAVEKLPYMIYYDYPESVMKISFAKVFRQCCVGAGELSMAVAMFFGLQKKRSLEVEVFAHEVDNFKKQIEELKARTVAITPKKKGKK